ncbi:protein NETWORKED 1A-like [Quillaja saponaria]|uniref:Protein NETWORKED 1A-like n=1 Tax=Quillaja saponaria TaxID=32244 RepID=A0AAD7Q9I8_QUISA|nr:protein NETWORKED 1A-like [Quillaja saponaria]
MRSYNLRETIRKLEDEVELRVDQRNALQQEIYCLKEELNALNNKHCAMLEQVESVGSDPDCFVSFVKSLQEEISMLKQSCEAERSEKITILEKLETMEKLMEKNSVLENSLSDLNVELEGVRGKVKVLEELCGSLLEQKSTLVTEKDTLIFQLQIRTENLKKLSEENNLLENSLFDVNAELEGLRIKSKSLEDLCLVLDNDKSSLISEKESLVSQLNITQQTLINLEQRCNQLELEHLVLETGRESSLQKVEELLVSLYAEREEHSKFVLLSESQLADRDLQIHLLSEDGQCRKKEYEEELDKAVNAQIEIFVLQKCVQDLKENNFALVIECQKLLDASNVYEKVISELEHENLQKQDDVKSLSENIRILRIGLLQVLETLGIDSENLCENKIEQDQMLLNHIYCELRESQNSLITICNENQELVIEKSVLVTILEQLKQKVKILVTERHSVHEEFRNQSNQFLSLKEEAQRILENNEELRLRIMEGDLRVEELETEAQNLWRQLSDLQGAHKNLQEESCMVFEERRSLIKTVFDLGEDKSNLEKEICVMLGETISQDNVSLIYKNIVFEKLVALKELSEDVDNLCLINKDLEENLKIMMGKLQDVQMENSHLSESLEKSDIKVKSFNSVNDKLTCEITIGREKLSQKENELLEAKRMLGELQNERMQLQKMVEDLETTYDEARVILEDQQKQILKLSSEKDRQNEELECLCEVNQNVESKMRKLHDEFGDAKVREEKLNYELQKGRNEIELWETQAATLYGELQISSVNETLFKEKVHELQHTCESLESRSISKGMEIELLKERLSTLEGENGKLHGQLAVYVPAISSLKDSIKSLENQALIQTKRHEVNNNEESKDDKMASHLHAESGQQTGEDQITVVPDALSDFNNLLKRIVAIERAVIEIERKHVTAVEEARNHWDGIADEHNMQKSMPDVSQSENEVLTKDIMLDQMSECSSYRLSRRGTIGANDQMLELWETTDKDGSVDLNVGKVQKGSTGPTGYHQMEQKNRYPSADSLIERELSVDKLEISGRHPEPCEEGNGRKTLERLDSDAQKLTNLQITIQDLKRKVEITDKSKHGKGIELDTVNGQLEDAQAAIKKLLDANRKLMKNVEDGSLSFDEKPAIGSDESGSVSRRRVSDQARRGSEKIGRLQLEVQRLQFLLLKLDDEKESRGKTKITERKTSVLLRDYLYGASRTKQKGKKASFCACVQPATKGD